MVGRPCWRSGSGREALPKGREWLVGPLEDPGGPLKVPGVLRRLSQRSQSGREALPEVQKWSVGPPGGVEMVGRPSQMSGSSR